MVMNPQPYVTAPEPMPNVAAANQTISEESVNESCDNANATAKLEPALQPMGKVEQVYESNEASESVMSSINEAPDEQVEVLAAGMERH